MKTIKRFRLTTNSNPFDPFDDFDKWFDYDCNVLGLNSSAYLARMLPDSDYYTDEEREQAISETIDEIISLDPFNIYVKASKEFPITDEMDRVS